MGYGEGILLDETNPVWRFDNQYQGSFDAWKKDHNPTTWIQNSVIWYSQAITRKLGMEKLKHYVAQFHYGNQNLSGDKGKNNGLTDSWLSSSLQISPHEQIIFLQKLIASQLPVSKKSQELTHHIIFLETLPNDWKLYGKTGSGFLKNADHSRNQDRQIGWFIGWIEKKGRNILFAYYIEDKQRVDSAAGFRAKQEAKKQLTTLIQTTLNDSAL